MDLYFNESITVIHVIVNVTDDQVPLEAVEEYSLVISNTNPSKDVTVGNVGTIRIIDDDGKCMCVLFYWASTNVLVLKIIIHIFCNA